MKAPWGVAAAGRVAANNGSALFAFASVPTEPLNNRWSPPLFGTVDVENGEAREGTCIALRMRGDSRGGRKPFAGGGVESRHAPSQHGLSGVKGVSHRTGQTHRSRCSARPACKPFAARVAGSCLQNNTPLLVLATSAKHLPGRLQPRAASTFAGAQADSTATYLISLARPTEQRAGSFANQQENQ